MEHPETSPEDTPAPRKRGRPRKFPAAAAPRTTMSRYEHLGPLPADELKANAWMHRALGIAAAQVVGDPNLQESERRKELCDLAARMAALTPMSKIHAASELVRQGANFAGQGGSTPGTTGPVMERVDASQEDHLGIPSRGPAARRGRPRKRSIR